MKGCPNCGGDLAPEGNCDRCQNCRKKFCYGGPA